MNPPKPPIDSTFLDIVKQFSEMPFWNFISLLLIVWVTHRFVLSRDKSKRMEEIQQEIYLSLLPEISEYFQSALEERDHVDHVLLRRFETKMIEIEGKFQIMGTTETGDALMKFSSIVRDSLENCVPADKTVLHLAYIDLNYAMCCHIHGEKFK